MKVATNQAVRTQLIPGDLLRNNCATRTPSQPFRIPTAIGQPARTQVTATDLCPQGRTALTATDDAATMAAARTHVEARDVEWRGLPGRISTKTALAAGVTGQSQTTKVNPQDLAWRGFPVRAAATALAAVGPDEALPEKTPAELQHEELTRQAQRLVSQTFFGSILRQMRKSPFKSDLFSGGRGGEAFGEMFDQQLADRMARGSGRQIADSLVKYIENAPKRAMNRMGTEQEAERVDTTG